MAVAPGATVTLLGNCVNADTEQPLTTGIERWEYVDAQGNSQALASNTLSCTGPNTCTGLSVVVPSLPGERTFLLTRFDAGYGGDINVAGSPAVTVTIQSGAGPAQQTAHQLTTPLLSLQTQRLRSQLAQADARLRLLRQKQALPAATISGIPVDDKKQATSFYIGGLIDYLQSKSQSPLDLRTTNLSIGADHRIDDAWAVGGSVGYSDGRVRFGNSASRQQSRGGNLTAYASWSVSTSTYLTGTVSFESTCFSLTRDELGSLTYASPRGQGVGLSVSAGRDFVFGPWTVGPYVRVDDVTSRVAAFSESGAATAISMSSQRMRSNTFNAGLQTQVSVPTNWGIVLPYVRVELTQRRNAAGNAANATLIDSNTPVLLPTTAAVSDKYGNVAVGIHGVNRGGYSWFADMESTFLQQGFRARRFGLGLRTEF